ncbi:hypothetical protein FH608_016100 [Nonomuraea phyllanthi]|uniref:DUF5666 domain-containing protein n=1 Tax=Nonomuraea phyllanthi TaxID=2219224 RepID=A0A5C4WK99_9ACTN|nr:DUF5666 domain-containing protein [Nonomuraea phyllanthi]KAB8194701.1 hypothetical protein FH608_016100 [Nonomuraea phyllanthi]QFY09122.1 hypothetical protein GBF35_22815 [Nonomuraea phyllanthi]
MEEGTNRRALFGGLFRERSGDSPLPPAGAPVGVLVTGSGRDVTVRGYGNSVSRFADQPVAAQAEELPYGWTLRPGDLVLLDEPTPGTKVAVVLHRTVTGKVTKVAPDSITVGGQTCRLDPRTVHYEGQSGEPSAKPLAEPLAPGDYVTLECFDNRVEGTLTVHFMRRTGRA